ncbi:hypothetical protein GCM10010394_00900 [Streptomyces crystallinus]|uniref:Uncharacterized protein n=1 Tax=Streptomyces crystallinus TaxID=68191 RepID=A0ABN1EWC9_9ACTN
MFAVAAAAFASFGEVGEACAGPGISVTAMVPTAAAATKAPLQDLRILDMSLPHHGVPPSLGADSTGATIDASTSTVLYSRVSCQGRPTAAYPQLHT